MRLMTFLILTIFIFTGYMMFSKKQEYYPSQGEQLINSILAKAAKTIDEKYNIKPCGVGVAMPGGPIRELTLCFTTKSILKKEQLRKLLIHSAKDLLKQVDDNDEIQPFLYDAPFNFKNIQIIIYNSDKDGREVYDPEVSTSEISQGMLNYATVDPEDTYKYKNEFKESYEDALKIIQDLKK